MVHPSDLTPNGWYIADVPMDGVTKHVVVVDWDLQHLIMPHPATLDESLLSSYNRDSPY